MTRQYAGTSLTPLQRYLFPPLPPMFIPGRTPANNCTHCGTLMHMTNECMSHAMTVVQAATRRLKVRGFRFITPDIHQYGKRQRTHAGPGWSHLVTIGYNDCGTVSFETGIAHLPNPTCVEDSGTFVEFRRSSHTNQAPVVTTAVTPTPCHYERKDVAWLYQ